jgi:CBS domain-containing protein/hemerythrin-like domain-containing protein
VGDALAPWRVLSCRWFACLRGLMGARSQDSERGPRHAVDKHGTPGAGAEPMAAGAWIEEDHHVIEGVLRSLDAMRRPSGASFPLGLLAAATHFFSGFVARHDQKEEQVLWPVLLRAVDVPADADTLARVVADHATLTRQLAALTAGARTRSAPLWDLVASYVSLGLDHVREEMRSLFPCVAALSAAEDAQLAEAGAAFDPEDGAREKRPDLLRLAERVARACAALQTGPRRRLLRARDVMRVDVPPMHPDESLARAAELMRGADVRALPVVQRGVVVGILTKTDLDPFRGREEWSTVRLAMEAPLAVPPDARVAEVARALLDRGFGAMPVVVDGVAVGMVARQDLLRVLTGAPGH